MSAEVAYLQARSVQGYKIHAVPATARRVGSSGRLTTGKTACGTVKGRDSMAVPALLLLQGPTEAPALFTTNPSDFQPEATICGACRNAVEA